MCGPAYGCSPRFMDGLAARGLDAIVEIRPSSLVADAGRGNGSKPVPASDLLGGAKWRSFVVPVAGVDRPIRHLRRFALGRRPSRIGADGLALRGSDRWY